MCEEDEYLIGGTVIASETGVGVGFEEILGTGGRLAAAGRRLPSDAQPQQLPLQLLGQFQLARTVAVGHVIDAAQIHIRHSSLAHQSQFNSIQL